MLRRQYRCRSVAGGGSAAASCGRDGNAGESDPGDGGGQAASCLRILLRQGILVLEEDGKLKPIAPLLTEKVLKDFSIDLAAELPAEWKNREKTAARLVREGWLITRWGMKPIGALFVAAEAGFVPGVDCLAPPWLSGLEPECERPQ